MIGYFARDDGGVTVLVAVLLSFALLFLGAIVVDAGYLYDVRAQLQAAADAGALEGCRVLAATDNVGEADAEARAAALANATGPGANLVVTDVHIDAANYEVQVEVAAQASMFFSRRQAGGAAGPATRPVVAVARARRQQLSGGRYLVPWAIPIIRSVDRVEVWANGVPTVLANTGENIYEGDVAIGSPADLELHVFNLYGVDETLIDDASGKPAPAVHVSTLASGYPFVDIDLSDDYSPSDAVVWPTITVRTAKPETRVRAWFDGITINLTNISGGTVWTAQLPAQSVTNDLLRSHPVDLWAGTGARDRNVDAYVHVRRSTNPVLRVTADPMVAAPGGTTHVVVETSEFNPESSLVGEPYTLRVGSPSSLCGNFGELNYNDITHAAGDPVDPPGLVPSGNHYYDWTVDGYPGGVHVGDLIGLSPGGSGSNTMRALEERQSRLQPGEPLVVEVPIVEKYEDKKGGTYQVIVLAFASFQITSFNKAGDVEGVFIQYIANPSTFGGSGGTTGIYAARLVPPQ